MQTIEQHPYVDQVLSPLPTGEGVGEHLVDDPALEFLEDEIRKVGSLAHNDIDWSRVERESLAILSGRSKDLKVLGFLMLALQRQGDGERFALSLYLLRGALGSWWSRAWPQPGERGARARRLLFNQMLQRAHKPAEGLSFNARLGDGRGFCLELVADLIAQVGEQGLPDEPLLDLRRLLERLPAVDETPPAPVAAPEPAETAGLARGAAPASLGELVLDPGNERATRQSLLRVAELLTGTEPANPLGYRLRRYAIWHAIASAPPSRDGQRTDLAAVSADRVADYREALERGADLSLWQRIEQSLSVSPFWLDGHWLSARAASDLGHEDCAEAIRLALKDFVERLPAVTGLTFSDGTPFLSQPAEAWLWTAPAGAAGAAGVQPWDAALAQAREQASQEGLGPALHTLESGLAEAKEPRDRFYWRLACARLLQDNGLPALARQYMQDLKHQVDGLALEHWEPGLIRQLERLAG